MKYQLVVRDFNLNEFVIWIVNYVLNVLDWNRLITAQKQSHILVLHLNPISIQRNNFYDHGIKQVMIPHYLTNGRNGRLSVGTYRLVDYPINTF